jgi:hypothetical protein
VREVSLQPVPVYLDPKQALISDSGESIWNFVERWSKTADGQRFALEGKLIEILYEVGFREISLRFVRSHCFWMFNMQLGPDRQFQSALALERHLYVEFRARGCPLLRHSISANVSGKRIRGAFILAGRKKRTRTVVI